MAATRTELIAGLRELADWLEAHPELSEKDFLPDELGIWVDSHEEFFVIARALGTFQKAPFGYSGDVLALVRNFGPLRFMIRIFRNKICRKVKKLVEQEVWECPDSLLADERLDIEKNHLNYKVPGGLAPSE